MRKLEYTVTASDGAVSLRVLVPRVFHLGTHAFRRLKVSNAILVNQIPRHVSYVPAPGDCITIVMPSIGSLEAGGAPSSDLIVYLDEDMMIVNKPAPMATLPGRYNQGNTLRELVAGMMGYDQDMPYHPVNRLDKGTSGLLCLARHSHAQNLLTRQLHSAEFVREYIAVTEGIPAAEQGTISLPIGKAGPGARRTIMESGKEAVTHYTVQRTAGNRAQLLLQLETGRTHQIRVHLAALGCPIVGDYLYGQEHPDLRDRFALHSAHLMCRQPVTGEIIDRSAPLPEALIRLLD